MTTVRTKVPEHIAIYRRVRDAILFGELVPGQAVTIQGLAEMIDAGMTPVREAIRRLTSEGALEALGNRRIVVPRLTLDQVDELEYARITIEPKLGELASKNMTDMMISELEEIDGKLNHAINSGSVEQYLHFNHSFHFCLYDAAKADILCAIARSLWLRSAPSLRVMAGRRGTASLPDMHDEAIAAVRSRDHQRVSQAIENDIRQGIAQIREDLRAAETEL